MNSFTIGCKIKPIGRIKKPVRRKRKIREVEIVTLELFKALYLNW
jgi:hypothetical protein